MSHGTGKWRHALSVSNIQPDFRVGDEQLDDDALLVADGDMDGSTTLCILHTEKWMLQLARHLNCVHGTNLHKEPVKLRSVI